jgi:hypothetical protein
VLIFKTASSIIPASKITGISPPAKLISFTSFSLVTVVVYGSLSPSADSFLSSGSLTTYFIFSFFALISGFLESLMI